MSDDERITMLIMTDFSNRHLSARELMVLWGFIPTFLDADDPRPAKEQFDDRYIGGWNSFEGFKLRHDKDVPIISYPGDPEMRATSGMIFRDEMIVLFPYSWVMIVQKDGTWDIARMD